MHEQTLLSWFLYEYHLLAVWIIGIGIDKLMFDSIVHGIERDEKMFKTKLWLTKNAF